MRPNERLMQRMNAQTQAKAPERGAQERSAEPSAQDAIRARMGVKKEPAAPGPAQIDRKAAADPFRTNINTAALRGEPAPGKSAPAPQQSAREAYGRPAERLATRMAAAPSRTPPQQSGPQAAPKIQEQVRQQQGSTQRPADRLAGRLEADTAKRAEQIKSLQQNQQRSREGGRGMS